MEACFTTDSKCESDYKPTSGFCYVIRKEEYNTTKSLSSSVLVKVRRSSSGIGFNSKALIAILFPNIMLFLCLYADDTKPFFNQCSS